MNKYGKKNNTLMLAEREKASLQNQQLNGTFNFLFILFYTQNMNIFHYEREWIVEVNKVTNSGETRSWGWGKERRKCSPQTVLG